VECLGKANTVDGTYIALLNHMKTCGTRVTSYYRSCCKTQLKRAFVNRIDCSPSRHQRRSHPGLDAHQQSQTVGTVAAVVGIAADTAAAAVVADGWNTSAAAGTEAVGSAVSPAAVEIAVVVAAPLALLVPAAIAAIPVVVAQPEQTAVVAQPERLVAAEADPAVAALMLLLSRWLHDLVIP
jgi:hypothetical protein